MRTRPTKTPALTGLQTAIYSAVTTLSYTVYDEAPENAAFPYVSIGETTLIDRGNKIKHADDHIETLHVWSRASGFKECKTMMAAIIGKLSGTQLTVTGYRVAYVEVEQTTTYRDPDGVTRHGIVQIRFNLTQE